MDTHPTVAATRNALMAESVALVLARVFDHMVPAADLLAWTTDLVGSGPHDGADFDIAAGWVRQTWGYPAVQWGEIEHRYEALMNTPEYQDIQARLAAVPSTEDAYKAEIRDLLAAHQGDALVEHLWRLVQRHLDVPVAAPPARTLIPDPDLRFDFSEYGM